MKNIVPHNVSISNEEVMSTELKNEFLALQHLHSKQDSQRALHHNTPTGSNTCLSSLSSNMLNLAVSTAMKAQHEIDSLMRGITELERMLKYQTENTENIPATNKHSQIDTTNQSASVINLIEQEEYD